MTRPQGDERHCVASPVGIASQRRSRLCRIAGRDCVTAPVEIVSQRRSRLCHSAGRFIATSRPIPLADRSGNASIRLPTRVRQPPNRTRQSPIGIRAIANRRATFDAGRANGLWELSFAGGRPNGEPPRLLFGGSRAGARKGRRLKPMVLPRFPAECWASWALRPIVGRRNRVTSRVRMLSHSPMLSHALMSATERGVAFVSMPSGSAQRGSRSSPGGTSAAHVRPPTACRAPCGSPSSLRPTPGRVLPPLHAA